MKGNAPLISVIVCTYNQEQTIEYTLNSILAQETEYSFEIIIGEDASPNDRTREVCETYVAQHPEQIHLMPKASNKGLLRNYVDCLGACRGKYVATCAGDDWWHNTKKLQLQVAFLETHADYGMVHTDMDMYYVSKNVVVAASGFRRPPEGSVHEALYKMCFVNAPTALFRRSLLQYVDFAKFIELKFQMEDYPMWLAMSRHTKFHFINQSTVSYRVLTNSASHKQTLASQIQFILETHRVQDYFYTTFHPTLPVPLKSIQNRMLYMACLQYGDYGTSFKYVQGMGLNRVVSLLLHTYVGGWLCGKILDSQFYKKKKGLQ